MMDACEQTKFFDPRLVRACVRQAQAANTKTTPTTSSLIIKLLGRVEQALPIGPSMKKML